MKYDYRFEQHVTWREVDDDGHLREYADLPEMRPSSAASQDLWRHLCQRYQSEHHWPERVEVVVQAPTVWRRPVDGTGWSYVAVVEGTEDRLFRFPARKEAAA